MTIRIQLRPVHLVFLSLIPHQIVVISGLLLPKEGQNLLIVFPEAMRYEYIIAQVVHFRLVHVDRNQTGMLSTLLEPTVKYHESFSVGTNHQVVDLMFRPHHGFVWRKSRHICVLK